MSDTIQIRAGNKLGMPTLADREIAYVRNENALYIGTDSGNKKVGAELDTAIYNLGRDLAAREATLTDLLLSVEALTTGQNKHGKTIAEHGDSIDAHSKTIAEHGEAITAHGSAIEAQGKTVAEHSTAIAEQKAALDGKLSASPVAAQAGIAADADLATAVAAMNALIAAMKNSGVMNT